MLRAETLLGRHFRGVGVLHVAGWVLEGAARGEGGGCGGGLGGGGVAEGGLGRKEAVGGCGGGGARRYAGGAGFLQGRHGCLWGEGLGLRVVGWRWDWRVVGCWKRFLANFRRWRDLAAGRWGAAAGE